MKLDVVTKDRDIQSNLSDGYDYGIDQSQMKLLYEIMSQYSNPIGSIVREITTNALDSHLEVDVNEEVTVRIIDPQSFSNTPQAFEVEDYGVGLSPDRIKNIYSKFLASTKRDSNKQHGAYGLGSKSPFSYTDMFTVTTVYEGMEYGYAIHKGREVPRIDKLYEQPSDKGNGTKININIKSGDRHRFRTEIKRQLAYFENINHTNTGVDNDYTIYKGKYFLFRPDLTDYDLESLHVCLGNVYYPLNLDMVNLDLPNTECKCPIALKFDIGELPVVWSRENIEYTDDAIKTIELRFEQAVEEIKEIYQDKQDDIDNITKYLHMLHSVKDKKLKIAENAVIPNVDQLFEIEPVYPKYSELKKLPSITQVLNTLFKSHKKVRNGIAKSDNYRSINNISYHTSNKDHPVSFNDAYLLTGAYSTTKNKFLYEREHRKSFDLVRRKPKSERPSSQEIFAMFGYDVKSPDELSNHLVKLMREYMIECRDYFLDRIEDYDDVEVTQAFKDARKGSSKTGMFDPGSDDYDPTLKIHLKELVIENPSRFYATPKYQVWEPTIRQMEKISTSFTIYGFTADTEVLEATGWFLGRMYNQKWDWDHPRNRQLNILKIAKNKQEAVDTIMENAIHVNEFYNKKHKLLVNGLTRFYIMTELESQTETPIINTHKTIVLDVLESIGQTQFSNHYKEVYKNVVFIQNCNVPNNAGRDAYLRSLPKPLHPLFKNPLYLNSTLIEEYNNLQSYFKKYPLLYQIFTDAKITNKLKEVIKEEMKYYLQGKTPINPLLEDRLQEYKSKKQLQP